MRAVRWILLMWVALMPLVTLVHRDDLGRWDTNRSAMAAPDEFSYLLLADNLIHGHGISTKRTLGLDTFYPPGYPLLLAAWGAITGLTVFHAHLLNSLCLCVGTIVAFVLARRLLRALGESERARFAFSDAATDWIALLIAALFATNWHVLEGGLYVFSEPAFTLVTLAWLALGLRWRMWHQHVPQAIVLALLAVAAWSIRGAGIVCVGTMLLHPLIDILDKALWRQGWRPLAKCAGAMAIVVLLAAVYQFGITWASPEKSLASDNSANNSYKQQLIGGLTKNGTINPKDPHQWPAFTARVGDLVLGHLDDYGAAFTPWFRESPDFHFLNIAGKIFGLLGLLGWLNRLFRRHSSTRLVELYVLFYIALYLVWPFNMTRFWAPLLPVMLVYVVDALRQFLASATDFSARRAAIALLTLLLLLSTEELVVQLGNYERRLNYVSDALATAASTVVRLSPTPAETIITVAGSDEHFLYAWYLPHGNAEGSGRFLPRSPEPHVAGPGTRRETMEELLVRSLNDLANRGHGKLFVIGYFRDPDYPRMFEKLQQQRPALFAQFQLRRVFTKEIIVTVWEFELGKNRAIPHAP